MALSDKNILITPNIGSTTDDPKIVFSGADGSTGAQNITLKIYPTSSGTLSFEGSAGQLFSITNSLSGTIYSVNDVSGIPSIEVLDTGLVKLAQYSGNVLLGTGTDNGTDKLQVNGSVSLSSGLTLSGGTANGVLYLNGSKVATSGSALTFDGSQVVLGGNERFYLNTYTNPTTHAGYFGRNTSSGNLEIRSQTIGGDYPIDFFTGSKASMRLSTNGVVNWYDGAGGDRMVLTSTGLGIGTSSPGAKLDVTHAGTSGILINANAYPGSVGDRLGKISFAYNSTDERVRIGAEYDGSSGGVLSFYTKQSGLAIAEKMRLDQYGNLGLGVTPSAWGSGFPALQIATGLSASLASVNGWDGALNAYYNGSNWIYRVSSFAASKYTQWTDGSHRFYTAPSGTAGNAISFTQAMTLDASGNLGIGATSVQGGLNVERSSSAGTVAAAASIVLSNRNQTSGTFVAGGIFSNTWRDVSTSQYTAGVWFEKQNSAIAGTAASQGAIVFGANDITTSGSLPIERARIDASGNFNIAGLTASKAVFTDASKNLTSTGTLGVDQGGTGATTLTGLVKGNGTSAFTAATAGTDYLAPPSGTSILKANSGGALANAVAGTDYASPSQTFYIGTTQVAINRASAALTLNGITLTDPAIVGAIAEDVYTISDGAAFEIDPGNGTIQLITLGASRTPKATNFAAGESVTLMVDDGSAYTITWTDATWGGSGVVWKTDSGVAPTLNTTGYTVIVLWKVSTQVYGARVGNS